MAKYIFITALAAFLFFQGYSQCTSMPAMPSCGGCTALVDNSSINSGQTYCYTGSGTVNGVNMSSGSTLIVCGNLTLNFNFNGGSIYIVSGGTLNIPGSNMNSASIYNYGTLNSTANLTLQGIGSQLMNASSATINMHNNQLSVSPGTLVNFGNILNVSNLVFQNGGTACLGNGSILMATNITNNVTNSVTVPSGAACMSFTNFAQLNNDLSATAALKICKAPGATNSGSFGSATVTANCSGCNVALAVSWIYFTARKQGTGTMLNWSATGDDIVSFIPEYSSNNSSWSPAGIVNYLPGKTSYSFADFNNAAFYRIRITDKDGRIHYSPIVRSIASETAITLLSNVGKTIKLIAPEGKLVIADIYGRMVRTMDNADGYIEINTQGLATGIYIFRFMSESGNYESRKIFVD